MIAAQDHGCAADVLFLWAPGAFGPTGSKYFPRNLTEFGPTLDKIRTPTALILPDDNVYDPDPAAGGPSP